MHRFKLTWRLTLITLALCVLPRTTTAQDLTWHDMSGAMRSRIQSIAVGLEGEVYASDDSGYVVRAEQNGSDWSSSNVGAPPSSTVVAAVLVHPTGRMFAVSGQKIYASDDKSLHWTQVGTWIRVSRTLGCTLRGTVLVGSSISSVFRSTNLGSTWSPASLPSGANEPAFLSYDSSNVFAATSKGVYRSQSDGASWLLTDSSTLNLSVKALARDTQGRIFAATDSGMYMSPDTGYHWTKGAGVGASAAVCDDRGTIICSAANDGTIYRTTDGGVNWQATGATLGVSARCLTSHPTWRVLAGSQSGIFGSTNSGSTWTRLASGLMNRHMTAIGVGGARFVVADHDSGLYSTIGERVWSRGSSQVPITQVRCVLGASYSKLLVGTEGQGVYRSTDGGATWIASNSGLSNLNVYALAARNASIVFAGTAGGSFHSVDGGATWTPVGAGLPGAIVRALCVCSGTTLFAGTDGAGIFRSTDNGLSWTATNGGLGHLNVRAMAITPGDGWLFAGTVSGGVYVSTDLGSSWASSITGLSDLFIVSLALNSNDDVFAATPAKVFRSQNHGTSWTLQTTGFPLSPVTGIAMADDDLLLAATDGAGVVGTTTVTPVAPPTPTTKWLDVGSLQNWFSSQGCEIEVGRSTSADQQDGWQWPAQYSRQDMQAAKGLWIGTTGYVDAHGSTFPRKVVHIGPRAKGTGEFIPVSMSSVGRIPRPVVKVQGVNSFPPIADFPDSVNRSLPVDRIINNTVNTSIGVTLTRRILQSSHQLNDNYIIQEYTFRNTGNTDADVSRERPDVTLDSVYFYFLYRLGICADTRYVIGSPTSWGYNTMLDTRGDGVMTDPPDQQFRAQFAWHGRFQPFTAYDNIGGPVWVPYYDKTDTVGRLGAAQFDGVLTLHADKSASDSTDDTAQPSTTSWENSDDSVMSGNSEFNTALMGKEFSTITRGHRSPRHAWQVEPLGNFSNPTGNPALGTGGGFSAANGYGPYRLGPGESVTIVVAEASAGLSREKCISVGKQYKRGLISATAKNDSVLTGRDSLFQTFRRAQAAYANGYALGLPPDPPKSFSVSPQAGGVMLTWDVFTEPGPHVAAYNIYRSSPRYDSERTLLVQLSPDKRSYLDSAVVRGVFYYYHITSVGDSLESSRFYTQTYDPAWLQPLSVDVGKDGVPLTFGLEQNYPNPFNPATTIEYRIAGQKAGDRGLGLGSGGAGEGSRWVRLAVYDMLGREVAALVNEKKDPGSYTVTFDASGLSTGMYFYRIHAEEFVETKRLLLLK